MHIDMYICIDISIHESIFTSVSVTIYLHLYPFIYTYMHMHVSTSIPRYPYLHRCTYMYVHAWIHIQPYISTSISMHKRICSCKDRCVYERTERRDLGAYVGAAVGLNVPPSSAAASTPVRSVLVRSVSLVRLRVSALLTGAALPLVPHQSRRSVRAGTDARDRWQHQRTAHRGAGCRRSREGATSAAGRAGSCGEPSSAHPQCSMPPTAQLTQ
jgi:hypothetical protein